MNPPRPPTPGPTALGRVLVETTPLVTELPAAACRSESALLGELRHERPGLALFESATGPVLANTRRTLLVTRALLRLEIRGGAAALHPLTDLAQPLIDKLTPLLAAVGTDGGGDGDDAARLRAPSILDAVRTVAGALADRGVAPLCPGLFGAFGYEFVDRFEALPPRRPDPLDEPDATFVLASDLVLRAHDTQRVHVITRGLPWEATSDVHRRHEAMVARVQATPTDAPGGRVTTGPAPTPTPVANLAASTVDLDDAAFQRGVERFREHIGAGDIFQGVLSRGHAMPSSADPLAVYEALRQRNPSPYMFFLDLGDGSLLGASPETFLRVERGVAEIRPIAGTVPRGFASDGSLDEDLDNRLALSLLLDRKEQAEHAMLLDLARNDIARVAVAGSTRVVQQFAIEKYSHVQHMVSRVQGRLQPGLDALHAYRAAANMGTLTGAPKVRAMQLIRAAEPFARGFYGGAAGFVLRNGDLDSCIVIRSLRHKDGVYYTRSGAGVVWDSVPQRELAETEHKARAVREAIAAAEVARG